MNNRTIRGLDRSVKVLTILVFMIFSLLLFRLWYLQIIKGEETFEKSSQNRTRPLWITAPRGNFYDRNGELLVTSRISHVVSVVPEDIEDNPYVIQFLSQVLALSEEELFQRMEEGAKYQKDQYIPLKRDVDGVAVGQILEAKLDLPGVVVEDYPVRNYPRGEWGAHLFGYLGEISEQELAQHRGLGYRLGDAIGKTGLEKTYDHELKGEEAVRIWEVDRVGQPILVLEEKKYVPGHNLHLTIDAHLQAVAEQAIRDQLAWAKTQTNPQLNKANAGSVIAIDPRNGAILAMVSYPEYDPNQFVGNISSTAFNELLNNPLNPFSNRVTRGHFMPGSTFKPITVLAALEEGLVKPGETFNCTGVVRVGNSQLRCNPPHGKLNVIDGLKNSCNTVMAELAFRTGPDKLAEHARLLGLGTRTGLNLEPTELEGLIGDPAWKRKARGETWYPMETALIAIGQSFVNVTPLQLAQVYASIASGGEVYTPQLVKKITTAEGETVTEFSPQAVRKIKLKPENLAIVREGLEQVVEDGTARYAFQGFPLDKIPVAGKTGTAENKGKNDFAFFASYAPADQPELVVVVVIEEGGFGSQAAAPLARKIYEAYFGIDRAKAATSQRVPDQMDLLE
ncbi:MAG TPA: penicillin-binding protein 2 [Firmicutes bacterium]|nr:penicillin-binding protein 2 [Bacillota bacterium]HBR33147.1 penicillin-binding protein 2 [Bacillota bacterium]